jgi:hypothetical protein
MLFGVNATAANCPPSPPALDASGSASELLLPLVNGGLVPNVGEIIDLISRHRPAGSRCPTTASPRARHSRMRRGRSARGRGYFRRSATGFWRRVDLSPFPGSDEPCSNASSLVPQARPRHPSTLDRRPTPCARDALPLLSSRAGRAASRMSREPPTDLSARQCATPSPGASLDDKLMRPAGQPCRRVAVSRAEHRRGPSLPP